MAPQNESLRLPQRTAGLLEWALQYAAQSSATLPAALGSVCRVTRSAAAQCSPAAKNRCAIEYHEFLSHRRAYRATERPITRGGRCKSFCSATRSAAPIVVLAAGVGDVAAAARAEQSTSCSGAATRSAAAQGLGNYLIAHTDESLRRNRVLIVVFGRLRRAGAASCRRVLLVNSVYCRVLATVPSNSYGRCVVFASNSYERITNSCPPSSMRNQFCWWLPTS